MVADGDAARKGKSRDAALAKEMAEALIQEEEKEKAEAEAEAEGAGGGRRRSRSRTGRKGR